MTITAQTSAQIKNAVSKIFKTNKRDLQTDTSDEGVAVLAAINTFLELSAPSFSDLITLREAIYIYQDQDSLGIRLYKASSDLQGVVKSLIAEKQFGYTELNSALAYEGIRSSGIPYADILDSLIEQSIAGVSYYDAAVAIATGVGAANDENLINLLWLDGVKKNRYTGYIYQDIQRIPSLGVDGAIIATTIAASVGTTGGVPGGSFSAVKSMYYLFDAILTNSNNNAYYTIISNIKSAVATLSNDFTYHDVAVAIATSLGASDNYDLINNLELDFIIYGANNINSTPQYIQSQMISLSGEDAALITLSFWNLGIIGGLSHNKVAVFLMDAIENNLNQVSYSAMVANINQQIQDLTDPGDVARAVATAINASNNQDLIYSLELFLNMVGNFNGLETISGENAPSIVYSILGSLNGDLIYSGELALMKALIAYQQDTNFSYSQILDQMKDHVNGITENQFTISPSIKIYEIINAINALDNKELRNYLEIDISVWFDKSRISLDYFKQKFAPINGDSSASLTVSLYNNLALGYGLTNTDLAVSLMNAIEDERTSTDTSVVTISSALGSAALTTGNNTIISGINELDEEIDVIKSTLTITPRSGAYLNKCTMGDGGVYTVGSSVFIGFDPEGDGILLSSMDGLNTLTGYINAMAQCATWQLTYENQDLYVSTTHAGGVTGTAEDTGCSPALDFASAGAYCLSVFDNYDYA